MKVLVLHRINFVEELGIWIFNSHRWSYNFSWENYFCTFEIKQLWQKVFTLFQFWKYFMYRYVFNLSNIERNFYNIITINLKNPKFQLILKVSVKTERFKTSEVLILILICFYAYILRVYFNIFDMNLEVIAGKNIY